MRRTKRIQCKIACEIEHDGRTAPGVVVDIASGGLGLVTGITLHEADAVRVRLDAKVVGGELEVAGIVWSERVVESTTTKGRKRLVLGVMLSDIPDAYVQLLAQRGVRESEAGPARKREEVDGIFDSAVRREDRVNESSVKVVHEAKTDRALPRAKFPLPPPKPTSEEELPIFSARAKLRGGARTRRMQVRAASVREAGDRIMGELGADWEILELDSVRKR